MAMETLPAGTQLKGRYRVERVLGNGGFGHVYLAVDLQTGQQYAIKEYLVAGASGKAQLEHEARVLSHLHHPSLPAFQDAFDERGRYYVVLGYIEGRDLTDCIRAARQRNEVVPLERVLNWLISICEAVTFLHNQQPPIIHRDIKPDNIRITSNGIAILVDLGNAKAAADGARTLLFIRHQGTPGYAPLEQYPGGVGTDTRSDVYALGGTLFFALTAHEPPSVSTRKQSSDQGMPDLPSLQGLLEQNPPEAQEHNSVKQFRLGINKPAKPAARHSRHLAQLSMLSPDLLNRLNLIIARAMAMDPWDRYQSVEELSADLQRVRAAMPISAQPSNSPASRPVDPHSTQPDLPFLFEAMQNARENTTPPSPDSSARPGAPTTQPPSQESNGHCPRCRAEVTRNAAFCPRCGSPLNADSSPQQAGIPLAKIQQRSSNASASAQSVVRASTPQQTPPRPFMQAATPVAPVAPVAPVTPTQKPIVIPGVDRTQQGPLSNANTILPSSPSPVMPGMANSLSSQPQQRTRLPKILLFFVIAIIVVIIAVAVFLVVHSKTNGEGSGGTTLQQARYYSPGAQVYNYERNISLCFIATTAHPDTRIRQCHTGIPASVGIAERVAGPRTRSATSNYRPRFT